MATTVGSHSVSAFATPVNGGPLDANVVRGNDNTIRTAYVAHDADTGIHVQSSTLAQRPTAGTAGRKWITADTGVYKLWYDDGTTWHEVAAGNIDVFVIAGEALVKGDVVKVTGYNNGTGAPIVAKMASASDTAFGIVNSTSIANGATGYITNTGLILDVATNAFSIGDILYPNTSGGFTATKPTSGNYQPVAFVLRSNANNGVLYVEFSAPRIVERSNNQASTIVLRDASGNFAAGTITAGALTSTGLVTFASLKGTGSTTVTNILDEDNMASDSATALATQQSIKAYVDAQVATVDTLAEVLANGNTTGANNIIVTAGQKITTNTIDETTSGSGVTIDSVLLKDDVVNATDIETGTVSANDGTLAVTIANSTGALTLASALADSNIATISTAGKVANSATTATSTNTNSAIVARDSSGNFSAGTITANLTGNISGTAPAGTLTGTTLASNVVSSSLTSVGTLTSLAVTGDLTVDTSTLKVDSTNNRVGVVNASPAYPLDVTGPVNSATGSAAASYKINGTDVLTATTLGSGVTASSLTSVGTLSSLTVSGNITASGGTANGVGYLNASKVFTTGTALAFDGNVLTVTSGTNASALVATSATDNTALTLTNTATDGSTWKLLSTGGGSGYGKGNLAFERASVLRMTLDASGNLGLGVTPSAWALSGASAMQVKNAAFWGYVNNAYVSANEYLTAAGTPTYIASAAATRYQQGSGQHIWYNAATGTAGTAITFTQAMTLDASGNLGVGSTSLNSYSGYTTITLNNATNGGVFDFEQNNNRVGTIFNDASNFYMGSEGAYPFILRTNATERARITSGGDFLVGKAATALGTAGSVLYADGSASLTRDAGLPLAVNRLTDDGNLVEFYQATALEGTISVSGNTVSYNAFAGSHWSQLEDGSKPEILRGTVMEALNDLCEWPGEQNERLPKCKVSDTAGSKKVYGVFMDWDNDWTETNDMYVTAVGAFICRISADVTVEQGDLLESNGDGTARVQADDVIRSSTIGKVTSTVQTHQYEDGTYCVPVVLYCG
jgi:hypothetical protein